MSDAMVEIPELTDAGGKRIVKAALEATVSTLLSNAKECAKRRGSLVIREVDMRESIALFRKLRTPKWYLIPVAGNGACLCAFQASAQCAHACVCARVRSLATPP